MYDRCMKLKKPLLVTVIVILLLALLESFSAEPLAHVIAPSTLAVDRFEWESCTQTDKNSWDYTYRLPNLISADDVVCLTTSWINVQVYVDDKPVFRYDDSQLRKGTAVHWIKVPLWAAGKTLHAVYSGEAEQVVESAGKNGYYGKAAMVYLKFVTERAYAFVYVVGAVLMMLLIAYFCRLLAHQLDTGMRRGLMELEMFLLFSMIWVVCDSKIMFIFSRSVATVTLMTFASLILFPMFLIMFIGELFGHRVRVIGFMPVWYGVAFIVVIGGYLIGLVPLDRSLIWIQMMIVLSAVVSAWSVVADMRRNRTKEMQKITMGFCGISFFGVVAIICYRVVPAVTYSLYVCIGLLVFAVLLIWAAYDRLYVLMGRQAKAMAYRRLAYKDVMTNLGNRAAFMKMQEELKSVANVGMVVMDINDLKRTNDQFGHQAGDEMICCAARCISGAFEEQGNVYRIGGDEFVAIVPDATELLLHQMLDRLHTQVEETWKTGDKQWTLHIACGWALGDAWQDAEGLFKQADDLMYENKHQMKNDREYRETHMQEEVLESNKNEEE